MEARELRTGNLFWRLFEESEEVFIAEAKNIRDLEEYEDNPDDDRWSRGTPKDYYAGIPITEEWLLKFGWKPLRNTGILTMDAGGKIDVDWVRNMIQVKSHYESDDAYRPLRHILSVHQLQNLYFTLTGEELKLNQEGIKEK